MFAGAATAVAAATNTDIATTLKPSFIGISGLDYSAEGRLSATPPSTASFGVLIGDHEFVDRMPRS